MAAQNNGPGSSERIAVLGAIIGICFVFLYAHFDRRVSELEEQIKDLKNDSK